MAAKSHSISSKPCQQVVWFKISGLRTFIEVGLVEVVRLGNIHVVETCDLDTLAGDRDPGEYTYIPVASEVLKQLDFSQGTLGQDFLAENIGDLLDGDPLTILAIGGCAVHRFRRA